MEKYWSNSDHSAGLPCILNECTDIVQRRGVPGPAEILYVDLYQLYTMWNFRHGPAAEENTSSNTMARSWIPLQATPPPSTSIHIRQALHSLTDEGRTKNVLSFYMFDERASEEQTGPTGGAPGAAATKRTFSCEWPFFNLGSWNPQKSNRHERNMLFNVLINCPRSGLGMGGMWRLK